VQDFSKYSDSDLLKQCAGGDKLAFREIFNRYWYLLYKNAFKLVRSHEEAEEIVQELFASLWNRRAELNIVNLPHYLNSAVRKRIVDALRSKMVHEKYWDYYKRFMPGHSLSTEETISYNELDLEIRRAITRLPEKSQIVFRLNRLEGRSVSEIATFLNLSERAIEYHLTQSLKALRHHLKDFIVYAPLLFLL
jgi:RNA polymerase sigma-70 factor (ECF subfamily)